MNSQESGQQFLPHHDQVVCTLFEGHYHFGFAVLLNSLLRAGFRGLMWAGYRGDLPPWTAQLKRLGTEWFELPNGAQLGFERLTPSAHFANYKPNFMLDLVQKRIARKLLWYFDPDITVRCSWRFFERWATFGLALCSDSIKAPNSPNMLDTT